MGRNNRGKKAKRVELPVVEPYYEAIIAPDRYEEPDNFVMRVFGTKLEYDEGKDRYLYQGGEFTLEEMRKALRKHPWCQGSDEELRKILSSAIYWAKKFEKDFP